VKHKQRPAAATYADPGIRAAPQARPSWPAFKPPLPVVELSVESLVPEKVVVLHNFFPKSLCKDYVSFLQTLPLTTTPGKPKRGEAVRVK
jgi:hypothetical protein